MAEPMDELCEALRSALASGPDPRITNVGSDGTRHDWSVMFDFMGKTFYISSTMLEEFVADVTPPEIEGDDESERRLWDTTLLDGLEDD